MSCPRPRIILEFWYPSDIEILRELHSRELFDVAFAPDLPFGTANADSLLAAWMARSSGIPALAAVSLGGRSAAASVSRIATAHLSGLDGVVLVAGDSRQCTDALGVLDALRLASSLPGMPEGDAAAKLPGMSAPLSAALRERPCFMRGAAVDLGSERSVRLAHAKAEAGANLFLSQLLPDPSAAVGALNALSSLGVPVALGIPYAPTEEARARLSSLLGMRAPSPADVLRSLEGMPRGLRSPIYVSPIGGRRYGLADFLESLSSIVA